MTKIYSLNSDVKFPDMEHYDMGKASDMALYLAHCDFYPFRSVIENNKIALDAIDEYSCAMKSHFRKFGNQMSGSGNHLCKYTSLLA